ncbi:hypothetical protein Sjap_025606 [Stephania japonica]|uniref:Uncharacterized protein n=1 Tax=Stephania japonica TaxID=461633 RepID=A0AAP0E1X8_9MAGN
MLEVNKKMSLLTLTSILLFISMAFTTINARIVIPVPVVDADGDPVQLGVYYHLVPFTLDTGGGLARGPNRNHNKTCPLSVVQLPLNGKKGLPIRFFLSLIPVEERVVRTSTDHIFQFNNSSICGKDPIWKLDAFDESVGKYFISTTNQITTDMKYKFKIERVGSFASVNNYKLSYCPTVCSTCVPLLCKNIGVY